MSTALTVPALVVRDGAAFADSRDVAQAFEKEHKHVLRDVDALLAHGPDLDRGWFREAQAPHPTISGRLDRSFEMTRDGFTLLAMGWTGPKALGFKLRYIAAFNAMEAELQRRAQPVFAVPQTLPEALRLAADAMEARAVAERVAAERAVLLAEQEPMVQAAERMIDVERTIPAICKTLHGVNTQKVQNRLAELDYLTKDSKGRWSVPGEYRDKLFAMRPVFSMPDRVSVVALPAGWLLLQRLYRQGELPMKSGFQPETRPMAAA